MRKHRKQDDAWTVLRGPPWQPFPVVIFQLVLVLAIVYAFNPDLNCIDGKPYIWNFAYVATVIRNNTRVRGSTHYTGTRRARGP